MNKTLLALAATPLVLSPFTLGAGVASAADVTSEASTLDVAGVLGVNETQATAGESSGSASAGTVTAGDGPLVEGVTGGSQEGPGSTSGAVVDTGQTPLGQVTVGGYEATVQQQDDGATTSSATSSLVGLNVGGAEGVSVEVLSASSEASSEGGSSSTDGVVIDVGGGQLDVVLLHSESGTDGSGGFVASINDQPVVSSDQADGCVVDADPLAQVLCFTAEQGSTTVETEGSILDVVALDDRLLVTVGSTSTGAAEEPEPATDALSAGAAALLVPDVLAVSQTEATAGESASATVVGVGGDPLLDGLTGGSQQGEGTTSGAVFDTGDTPLGRLQVAPFEATVEGDTARSEAAVAELTVIDDETLTVTVLGSQSEAGPDGSSAGTQGVVVDLADGRLELVVLDSSSNGSGEGSASVVVVNGEPVVSSEQADGCALDAGPVALACVTAEQGTTTVTTESAVADVELVEDQLVVTLVGSDAEGRGEQPAAAQAAEDSNGSGDGNQDSGNQDSGSQDSGSQDSGSQDSGNQDSAAQGSGNQASARDSGAGGTAVLGRADSVGTDAAGASAGGTGLPVTGAGTALLALAAVTALGLGGGALVAGRRRTAV